MQMIRKKYTRQNYRHCCFMPRGYGVTIPSGFSNQNLYVFWSWKILACSYWNVAASWLYASDEVWISCNFRTHCGASWWVQAMSQLAGYYWGPYRNLWWLTFLVLNYESVILLIATNIHWQVDTFVGTLTTSRKLLIDRSLLFIMPCRWWYFLLQSVWSALSEKPTPTC